MFISLAVLIISSIDCLLEIIALVSQKLEEQFFVSFEIRGDD